jgi:hypothetical protein
VHLISSVEVPLTANSADKSRYQQCFSFFPIFQLSGRYLRESFFYTENDDRAHQVDHRLRVYSLGVTGAHTTFFYNSILAYYRGMVTTSVTGGEAS